MTMQFNLCRLIAPLPIARIGLVSEKIDMEKDCDFFQREFWHSISRNSWCQFSTYKHRGKNLLFSRLSFFRFPSINAQQIRQSRCSKTRQSQCSKTQQIRCSSSGSSRCQAQQMMEQRSMATQPLIPYFRNTHWVQCQAQSLLNRPSR